jgi:N-acetyl sugar amidotransferase
MNTSYKICTRCVMDTTADNITFNELGVCNYCEEFSNVTVGLINPDSNENTNNLNNFIEKIKFDGRNKKYDCIIGVSGGVDSSWVLVKAKKLGLRPLAVHMDNGWNSELAQNNIENLINILGVDFYTHVINWEEYRELMQAFFDADVIDVELLYDNAMLAVNYKLASSYGIKYILSGSNISTEGMRMPNEWNWFKRDKKNIKGIAKRFGNLKIKSFPAIGVIDTLWYEKIKKIKWISFLDYFDYNKNNVIASLMEDYNYKPYPFKHYESIFTRFYQGYILPQKFNVDKRKLHFSTLIISGQLNRNEAIRLLDGIPYENQSTLEKDKLYFIKKMGWSIDQLENYIQRPPKKHSLYPSSRKLWNLVVLIEASIKNPQKAFSKLKSFALNNTKK